MAEGVKMFAGLMSDEDRIALLNSRTKFARKSRIEYHWAAIDRLDRFPGALQNLCKSALYLYDNRKKLAGIEFWTVELNPGDKIGWHVDKDEVAFWGHGGVLSHPEYSFVSYIHDDKPEGGELEVEGVGLFEPIPNTTVLLPGNISHRVLEVRRNSRVSIVLNLWSTIPMAYV